MLRILLVAWLDKVQLVIRNLVVRFDASKDVESLETAEVEVDKGSALGSDRRNPKEL